MDKSDVAIGISIASLALSAFKDFRDRSCLKAKSKFNPAYDGMPTLVRVEAVNVGRRPLVLAALGGKYADGNLVNINIGRDGQGVQLLENGSFSMAIEHQLFFFGETCSPLKKLWLKDTSGKRYGIKGVKRHLEMYFNSVKSNQKAINQ